MSASCCSKSTDSAPVLEKPLAQKAGLGWIGKHTCLITRRGGSWFFLGEIYCDLALPIDEEEANHCGTCQRCIDVCPTEALGMMPIPVTLQHWTWPKPASAHN